MSESERLLGAIRCDHWALSNDEIDALHQALLEADADAANSGGTADSTLPKGGEQFFCHGDGDESPTCYERMQQNLGGEA